MIEATQVPHPEAVSTSTTSSSAITRRWIVAFVMLGVVVTGFFDRISVAVLFTNAGFNADIGTAFDPARLGMLMTAFLLAYATSALFLSFVGDLVQPRHALAGAAAVWGVLMVGMGTSGSYVQMLAARVVLGVFEGPQFSLISKVVRRWFPPHERGRANAVWMIGSPLGSAIGFPLTIWLVATYGWRASFYVLGLLNLFVVAPLVFTTLRERAEGDARAPAFAAESRASKGTRAMLKDPKVWMLAIYGAGLLTYLWGLNGWLPTYLQKARHFDIHQMGIYSSLPFLLMFLAEMASGFISDRYGRRALLSCTGLLGAAALLFLATKVAEPHLSAVLIALSAGSWGLGLPAQYALAMEILPSDATSTGIGIINGVGNLVGACAPAVIGWTVARTGDFQAGLLPVVLLSAVGALSILPLVRAH